MLKLEDLQPGIPLVGLEPSSIATVASLVPIGDSAVKVAQRLVGNGGDPNATLNITLEINAEFPSGASDRIKRALS